ncbi:MAG: ribonuclease HII [Desulforhopalus sp.]
MNSFILPDMVDNEDNFRFERFLHSQGLFCIAGCDEAGRGPLAGPVVAACVVLPTECDHSLFVDSKILSHPKRLKLSNHLLDIGAFWGIGIVSEHKIDEINILQGSLLAMKRAVENLPGLCPDFILVDGKFTIPLLTPQEPLVKGESKSASIAAASILAKVERDRIMTEHHQRFPIYNFQKNKGYPTREHRQAIQKYGICAIHRKSFRGVREYAEQSTTSR